MPTRDTTKYRWQKRWRKKTDFPTKPGVSIIQTQCSSAQERGANIQRLVDQGIRKTRLAGPGVYIDDPGLIPNPQKSYFLFKTTKKGKAVKRGPFDGKGLTASTSLFCQPCLANPINQLQLNGKTSFSVRTRHEEAEEILPSTPDGAFDITYRPRTSIRIQFLADFIAKKPDEDGPSMEVQAEEAIPEPWTIFTDGSWCLEGSGAGLILTIPEGEEFTYALRFEFDASNNEAE
ncbi:hypothetical protein Tco_0799524 [Tanacetum coccineum]|uniref:Uncharacterized protein n=1 Tax=Tanacetum coccineum TaxID=301880 RepID=A0ABQ4ZTE5_9ASTR